MNFDDDGCVVNGPDTFRELAHSVREGPTIIAWTDGIATQYDILFVLHVSKYGSLQGGLSGRELFVSIMRKGAFGFAGERPLYTDYIGEKLFVSPGPTLVALADLINAVLVHA